MGEIADGALHADIAILTARLYTRFYITTRKLRPLLNVTLFTDVAFAIIISLWHSRLAWAVNA